MKVYFILPKPSILEPHDQMQFSVIHMKRHLVEGVVSYPFAEDKNIIFLAPTTGHTCCCIRGAMDTAIENGHGVTSSNPEENR